MITALSPAEAGATTEDQRQFRAFVQDDATRKVVDQVIGELAIPNASVQKGGVREATRFLGEQRSPRLLVVDLTGIELALSAIDELAEVCEPGVTVIALGDRNDVGLFRDLINNGVSDYLVKGVVNRLTVSLRVDVYRTYTCQTHVCLR
jgi:pilus assembly protein CpaE